MVELFAAQQRIPLKAFHELFFFGAGQIDAHPVAVAIPNTSMNESGRAVVALLATHAFLPASIVLVYDEIDLPVGHLRLRRRGRDAGHQGVRSVITAVQTDRFWRLKLGIGRPPAPQEAVDYVLSLVPPSERPAVEQMKRQAVEALRCLVVEGPETAMNRYNQRNVG